MRAIRPAALVVATALSTAVVLYGFGWAAPSETTFSACVRSNGRVRAASLRAHVEPTCKSGEDLESWSTAAPSTASVVKEYVVKRDPVRYDIDGDTPPGIGTPLTWHRILGTSATITTTNSDTLLVRWSAASVCFGTGRRYVRFLVDGAEIVNAPLSGVLGHTSPFPPVTVESPIAVESSTEVGTGTHHVTLETAIDVGTTCAIGAPNNHLIVEVLD